MEAGEPKVGCEICYVDSVAYLLKARNVEAEKQPLLSNALTQE
jgi:hypothetical protein